MPAPRADNTVAKHLTEDDVIKMANEQTEQLRKSTEVANFKFAKEWKGPTEQKVLVLVRVLAKSQRTAENIVEKELGWFQDQRITRAEIAHINKNPSETDDHCPTCTCNK